MKTVLVVGGGGREHALAVSFAGSSHVERVLVAPGNGGTDRMSGVENVPVAADDLPGLMALAKERSVDLTFVGPEVPLAAGLVDSFEEAGLRAYGPSAAAARLEASKVFAKDFMVRHGIPAADSASFVDLAEAQAFLVANWGRGMSVLKASGLAAGKGVLLPETLAEAQEGLAALIGRGEVLIEERLAGEEVSLLAFCDGSVARVMPPGRDHKRIFDGDRGPNTGGMGAFAPTPALSSAQIEELERTVLQRAVDGMASDGTPYVGVLYAGLMLTPAGVRVLEFNCRFGDPETQVLLPLLETDLYDVVDAAVQGRLAEIQLRWHDGAAATVVLASEGYPGSYPRGRAISGIPTAEMFGATVFHAGTRATPTGWETSGGRVVAVTGTGVDLAAALARAYAGARAIHFEGRQLRNDIGASQT